MADWLSYRPADFIMLSEPAYWGLVEQANAQVDGLFPYLPAVAVTVLVLFPHRLQLALLGLVWAWVGWSFLWVMASPVNAIAGAMAPAFGVQAALCLAFTAHGPRWIHKRLTPLAIIAWSLALHPMSAPAFERPFAEAEWFAVHPDPTAMATLGFALLIGGWRGAVLAVIPAIWLVASAIMLDVFGAPERWVPTAFLALAAVEVARRLTFARR